jgi:hypothetical protein
MVFSACAAQGAGAVGQRWYTCWTEGVQSGTQKFSDNHCKEKSSGPFYHIDWSGMTIGEATNETTAGAREPAILKVTIGGLPTIIEAKKVSASAMFENLEAGGEQYAEMTAETIVFEEVTVTNRACEFIGINPGGSKTIGKVETQPIRGSTKGQATTVVKFEPQAGPSSKWAEFELAGASCPAALKGAYPVFGTVVSNASEGATIVVSHETVTGEPAPKLRLKSATEGPVVGLAGKITDRAGATGTLTPTWRALTLT